MLNVVITTTEQGMGISLVPTENGKVRTIAFPFKSVEFVDHLDGESTEIHFKSGSQLKFSRADGISSADIINVWKTVIDNM